MTRRLLTWCLASALFIAAFAVPRAESPAAPKPNYDLAANWTAQKVGRLVFDTTVTPRWLESGDRFWYPYQTREGRKFYLVDAIKKSKVPLFDHAKMAATLTSMTREPYDAQHLPFTTVKFVRKDAAFQFDVQVPRDADVAKPKKPVTTTDAQAAARQGGQDPADDDAVDPQQQGQRGRGGASGRGAQPPRTRTLHFEYDMATGSVDLLDDDYKAPQRPRWAAPSPDGKTIVFARNHNLFMMDADSFALAQKKADDAAIKETQLTKDGEEHYSYARSAQQLQQEQEQLQQQQQEQGEQQQTETDTDTAANKNARVPAVQIIWSKDSKKFALVRRDQRKVADLWVIDALAQPRPKLETYRYAMPGEANVTQYEIDAFDVPSHTMTRVKADRFKDQTLQIATAPVSPRFAATGRGGGGGQGVPNPDAPPPQWLSDTSDKLYFLRSSRDLHKVDAAVASPDTGEVKVIVEERLNTYIETKPLRLANNGQDLLFWSERTGWGHYYLYDANSGALKNPLTSGEYVTMSIDGVDDKARVAYVSAVGRESGEDPYYPHLYRVSYDGATVKLLDPGDASHAVTLSESNRFFVDNASRIDAAPSAVLYDTLGNVVTKLEIAGSERAERGRLQVSRAVQGEGGRRRHGLVRRDVQAVRLRPAQEIPDRSVRLPGTADRKRDQDVQSAKQQPGAGAVRVHRGRGRESRRQPAAVEVVSQLRLRESARLWSRRQEGGRRAAGEAPFLHRREQGRHLGTLRRRVHVDRGHAGLPGLLQGGGVRIGEPREQYLQQHLEREAPRPQGARRRRRSGDVRVRHREEFRAGQEFERPPDAVDRRHRQQRPSGEYAADGRCTHQGQQTVRHARHPRRAPRLRRPERILQLDPLRLLLPLPSRSGGGQRRHRRAEQGEGAGREQETEMNTLVPELERRALE